MKRWQLYIRHAHRDTADRFLDNGLSEKGFRQVGELVDEVRAHSPLRKPERILSSPKLRCLETAQGVADWAGVEVEVEELLDEQGPTESTRAFLGRIAEFIARYRDLEASAFVSHGDVLPLIADRAGRGPIEIRKSGYFWVSCDDFEV